MPTSEQKRIRNRAVAIVVAGLLLVFLAATSARWLVVDDRQKSDVIVVLAGETERRPALGLELLRQGYGRNLILDVPAEAKIYQSTLADLAQKYVQSLPEASSVSICPIHGLSTKEEAGEAGRCLDAMGGRKVLLVTSDFHTRRARAIFRKLLPNCEFSVAAAHESREFGQNWWQQREWAKTNFYEWLRLGWWELIDRWR